MHSQRLATSSGTKYKSRKEMSQPAFCLFKVCPRKLSVGDLIDAINRCGRTVKKEDLKLYTEFTETYGQVG